MITNLSKGKGHFCRKITAQDYTIGWCYDYYPKGVTWMATRRVTRNTDIEGAKRFCKKWGIAFQFNPTPSA